MNLYLINIGLIAGVLVVLGLVTWGLRRWRDRQADELTVPGDGTIWIPPSGDRELFNQLRAVDRVVRILNIATSAIALIPLGLGIYNLVTNSQRQALTFNLAALATLITTKAVLFLLTLVLIPFLKAVPVGMGTTAGSIIAQKVWKWLEARNKAKPAQQTVHAGIEAETPNRDA